MGKYSAQKSAKGSKDSGKTKPATGSFKDRNLAAMNPLKNQFEPTPAEPVNQHKRMAGTC